MEEDSVWKQMERNVKKEGFREGAAMGHAKAFQDAFDEGYSDGLRFGKIMGEIMGYHYKSAGLPAALDGISGKIKETCVMCTDNTLTLAQAKEQQALKNDESLNLLRTQYPVPDR